MKKYDFKLDMASENSLSLILNRIKVKSLVLEFGPAYGRMTRYLKENLGCKVYCVELDKEAAQKCRAYCKDIVVDDIENFTWEKRYRDIEFDYIVFADVLEHLFDPVTVLKRAKKLLKQNGSIMVSLPNIAHNSIIINLLRDKFEYRDIGLLDKTHIRFFTKKSIDDFVKECGLYIAYQRATFAKPYQTEFGNRYSDIDDASLLIKHRYGEAYQFVSELKKYETSSDISLERSEIAQLFYSFDGKSLKCLESKFMIKNSVIVFDLPDVPADFIRIDPLSSALTIKVTKIVVNENIEMDLSKWKHNGVEIEEHILCFKHDDPQIVFNLNNSLKIKKIELYFEYIQDIFDLKSINIKILSNNIKRLQKSIDLLNAEIVNKNFYIDNLETSVNFLEDVTQILRINNTIKRAIKRVLPSKVTNMFIKLKKILSGVKNRNFRELVSKARNIGYSYTPLKFSGQVKKEIDNFDRKPLISIIMPVYNVEPKWLDKAINSVLKQWYENWELCIVDDCSSNKETLEYLKNLDHKKIKVKFLDKNINISGASNEALMLANGEFVALMDDDDEITSNALYEVVKVINNYEADFIYSDEDKIDMSGKFVEPHFKADYSPDMLLSQNYISHFSVIKKKLVDNVGGWETGLEGSQDYDLYLKVLEYTDRVYHIPKVLYHWRKVPGSTASKFDDKSYAQDNGKKALLNALKRRGVKGVVKNGKLAGTYKVEYAIRKNPLLSIIIPFKDKPELLKVAIESILKKTTYQNYEIIGISNNSQEQSTFDEMRRIKKLSDRVKFYEYNIPFNYSAINNYAVFNLAKGEQIVLMNNDIEIISSNWIEEMLMFSQQEQIGVVGAKLYYPNDTIQHAGVIIGLGGVAGHSHKYFKRDSYGYFGRLQIVQNLSALTAALFMIKKDIFIELGGLNEKDLKVAFNDVDFCLRARERGYLNIFTPYCEAYHHESITRGGEDSFDKKRRFEKEIAYMKRRHSNILRNGDPYYNKNLTLNREDFSLA